MNKKIDKYLKISIIIVISMIFGSLFTIFLKDNISLNVVKSNKNVKYANFNPLFETYEYLIKKYYKKIDNKKLVDGAINGMLEATGDEHTSYLNKEEKEAFEEELSGSYYGIGAIIILNDDKTVSIHSIFDNSPAEKAGLKIGDIFLKIDGKSVEGKNSIEVSKILKSQKRKKIVVTVKRGEEELDLEVTKENIILHSVNHKMLDNNIGYMSINIFGDKTYSQFLDSLNLLEKDNMKSLIIDLRGNSGGYLTSVSQILSVLMDKDTVIYQIKTKNNIKKYKSMYPGKKDYKIVVLVNEFSASASEIMASSLQEKYGAVLVGKKTYGKGTVQTTANLSNNGMIKYTIQEWLTPNGNSIDKVGITPDYEVEIDENYNSNPIEENDNQLNKAIELLK